MNIILKPDAVNFSGNLKRFKISTTSSISFILKQGSRTLFEASYTPGSNQMVEIDVKDIIEADLNVQFRNLSYPYEQPDMAKTYTAYVDEQSVEFTVVKGGVDNLATADVNFMQFNWLTWQPQIKKVTYYLPEMLTFFSAVESVVKVKAYFKEDNGSYSEETKQLLSIIAGKAYTIPVQYAVIAGEFDSRMPAFYDVWFENTEGVRLSYIQRYVASGTMSEDEQWIIFENSLGGFDTFRAYGTNTLSANHEHQLAEMDEETNEYRVDTSREYTKNTGYLSGYERKWMLDFFPSKQKYLYDGNSLRKIIVTEDSTSYVSNQLPTSYEFTYKYADAKPYLNLIRPEELPTDLDIQVPELGSFTIPPRLVEFPSQNLTEGVLFPVQNPYSENWATTTIGAILNYVLKNIIELGQDGSGGIGHTHPNLELLNALEWLEGYLIAYGQKIKAGYADVADDLTEKARDLFLKRYQDDSTNFLIKFLAGSEFGEFIDSMIAGKGAGIFPDGRGQFEKLEVRSAMIVKELIYNRWFAQEGNVTYSEAGTIERIELLEDGTYDLYLRRRWDNDITAFKEQDVSYGSVNNLNSTGEYYDSWFRVLSVMQAENKINVVLYPDEEVPGGKNYPPASGMVITRRGNAVDEERQGFWYISSYEGCIFMLDGVTKPILEESNYSIIIGKLKRLELFDNLPINYRQSYVYCRGIAIQDLMRIDYQGVVVVQLNDRGFWSLEVAQGDNPYTAGKETVDTVWHYGCRWKCLVTGTTDEPRYASTGWAMIEGNPEFSIDFESDNGWNVDDTQLGEGVVFTTFRMTGKLYNRDITEYVLDTDVTWTRDTGNVSEDNAWAIKRADAGKILTLTEDDLGIDFRKGVKCLFKCTAILRDGQETKISDKEKGF
jgi:hypothetical protein|nr:MAG TPA: hypothetical protein [Bacteriophage sp.]